MFKDPSGRISWGAKLPHNRPPIIDIVKPSQHQPVAGYIVNERITEVALHWWQGRTVPHLDPREFCEACVRGHQQPRWTGYVLISPKRNVLKIAHLTEQAALSCDALLNPESNLRGLYLTVARAKKGERGKCKATLTTGTEKVVLPDPIDLMPVLLYIWGMHPEFPPLPRLPEADDGQGGETIHY